jgi:predicted nucleic acid-binding protein
VKSIVVDASVAVKWVVAEDFSDQADLLKGSALCAPAHWQAEAVNVLWAKVYRGDLLPAGAIDRARMLMQAPVELVPLSPLMDEALKQSLAYGITIYDSLYLALAVARDIAFVTADRKLLQKLSGDPNLMALVRWVGDLER